MFQCNGRRDGGRDTRYYSAMTKVLLIDDDRKHSDLMQAYFKRYGINLLCAYDSVEGFKLLATARGDIIDRVSGLELGADDYVGKPFEPRELVARVQATLRRSEIAGPSVGKLSFDGLTIETETRTVEVDGETVDLTSMEFELLLILARRHGRKLSRDDILSELRGIDAAILTRSVDIMVSRLRQKLGDTVKPPRFIQTIWGRGYSFIGVPQSDA